MAKHQQSRDLRIPVEQLAVGMRVTELDRPWLDTPFTFQGFTISSHEEVREVQRYCRHVFVQITEELREFMQASTQQRQLPRRDTPLDQEIEPAKALARRGPGIVRSLFDDIQLGRGVDMKATRAMLRDCVDSVVRNPDAMLLMTRLQAKDEDTAQHSFNVSVLATVFGEHIGLNKAQLLEIGECGLFHDIGKLKIPDRILRKSGPLTRMEFSIIKDHSAHGRDVLMATDGVSPAAIDVAWSLHEHVDGRGYPRGLTGEAISEYARMIAIIDAYDSMTSWRRYADAVSPHDALKLIFKSRGRQFDARLATRWIECIGIFPPGAIVEMENREVGIVLETNRDERLKPKVRLILNENHKRQPARDIDMGAGDVDAQSKPYRIAVVHPVGSFDIDLEAELSTPHH